MRTFRYLYISFDIGLLHLLKYFLCQQPDSQ